MLKNVSQMHRVFSNAPVNGQHQTIATGVDGNGIYYQKEHNLENCKERVVWRNDQNQSEIL